VQHQDRLGFSHGSEIVDPIMHVEIGDLTKCRYGASPSAVARQLQGNRQLRQTGYDGSPAAAPRRPHSGNRDTPEWVDIPATACPGLEIEIRCRRTVVKSSQNKHEIGI
jgi:hypothetical protein